MKKTITLAELMRQMGMPFDINPFVNAYIQQERKKMAKRAKKGQMPQQMQQPMQQPMPPLAMLSRSP